MSLSVRVIFDTPQREVASLLTDLYARCMSASLIAGFMTVEGIDAIEPPILASPGKLAALLIGAGTYRAFEAFDQLLKLGVPPDRLRVHLGHSRQTKAKAKNPFYRYHPMLHSKVYLFELPNGTAAAFIGSHNLTGFALYGLNGEAGVLLDGPADADVFADVRAHISAATKDSVQYDPTNRDAYAWWAGQFMEGFARKFRDLPQDAEAAKTIVILAERSQGRVPGTDHTIYFELPKALGRVQSMRADVHVYLFDKLPATPAAALDDLTQARTSYWCRTIGIEDDRGGRELWADWYIDDRYNPVLRPVQPPFRPKPAADMQQLRVQIRGEVYDDYEYLFDSSRSAFEPEFDEKTFVKVPPERVERVAALKLIPPEHTEWFRVKGIRRVEPSDSEDPYHMALRKVSPEGGSFVLMSVRRRSRSNE